MQNKTLLIIGFVWPEPSTTAAGGRMLRLIQFFLSRGARITFASAAAPTELSLDMESLGVSSVPIKLNSGSFDHFIKELNPDMVVFDRFLIEEQFGWRVAECVPNALRILDTEDLHSLRKTREKCFKEGSVCTLERWARAEITKREIASIFRCDLSLIVSAYEMQLLSDYFKIDTSLLLHVPFLLDEIGKAERATWPTFDERQNLICIGNGRHAPNSDAVVWLKNEIWPLIYDALPHVELSIYGAYLPDHIKRMHSPEEGFLVKGWTDSVKEVMQNAKLNLAPLRFGAGIKGKLTDAMQCGTPSVTTSMGIEGMFDRQQVDWQVFDTAATMAEAAIDLYTNRAAWLKAQQTGVEIINSYYDKAAISKRLESTIEAVQTDLTAHRSRNFIGSMLMHHSMQSTKYLSKWIASKG